MEGILVVEGKVLKVKFTNNKGKEVAFLIPEKETDKYILNCKKTNNLAKLNNLPVYLEVENGQPCQVRPQKEILNEPNATVRPQNNQLNNRNQNQPRANPGQQPPAEGDFHNPYNFVPALPRNGEKLKYSELGDLCPSGHDQYYSKYWSGKISVKLTTKTPLLIPDASQMDQSGEHKIYPLRKIDGKPYLPPTSIKGMLRAAYEAVTNSRLSVFEKHDQKLMYRSGRQKTFYSKSPQSLLDKSLQPAQKLSDLSPADRVFGWVNQNGEGAYRGNLRIFNVLCTHSDPIQKLGVGLPLAILGQPKPQQGRFYAAKDAQGRPFDKNTRKQDFYQAGTGLRGRKVYPHHRIGVDDYWNPPAQTPRPIQTETAITPVVNNRPITRQQRTIQAANNLPIPQQQQPTQTQIGGDDTNREYLRLGEAQDNQNRSITEWVKPDVTFEFEIEVTNLSSVELGALLWLLDLPENNYHRLGGGKPLGFGSVDLAVEHTELRNGEELGNYYRSLLAPPAPIQFDQDKLIAEFKQAVKTSYGSDFQKVSFIKAFCRSAQGFIDGNPIHYPRRSKEPNINGESFKWFVENEKNNNQHSLGYLPDDSGLPLLRE